MQSDNKSNERETKQAPYRDRDFEEVEGGYYDTQGYYITPEGSFWDENLVYFNREGFDKYGGTFDEYGTYLPGPGWNEEFGCYEAELGSHSLINNDMLKQALQETIKEELLDEYHYYQNFFKEEDETTQNIRNLEIPEKDIIPLKEEYNYNKLTVNSEINKEKSHNNGSQNPNFKVNETAN
jgi:hypothetical protein